MPFSDTTTKSGLIQRIEDHTQLGDGAITGDTTLLKKMTAHVNEALYDITTEIMMLKDGFEWDDPYRADYPVATTPLVANQRDYQFDSISFLKLRRVDITYDGTNWKRATPFTSTQYSEGLGNDSLTDEDFSKEEPMYDPKGFGFWLYPRASAADVAAGAKARIEYARTFEEFTYTDTTAVAPIDRPFHDLVAIGAALKWSGTPDKQYAKLSGLYQKGLERLRDHYANRNEDSFLSFRENLIENYK